MFSSGIFGIAGGPGGGIRIRNGKTGAGVILDDAGTKKGLRLLWFGIGKDDFFSKTSQATVDMLKNHQFQVVATETAGGHTWINWRQYLHQFAPLLFTEK